MKSDRLYRGLFRASLAALVLFASGLRADTAADWLAKVPPPPRNADESQILCSGYGDKYDSNKDLWRNLQPKLDAAKDAAQKETQQKLQAAMGGDPAAIAAQQMAMMSDPGAMLQQQQQTLELSQYQQTVFAGAPDAIADGMFTPAYNDAADAVGQIVKAENAKLTKCPMQSGEAGDFPIPSCGNPIQHDALGKKTAAVNAYLASIAKAWPPFTAKSKDYLGKLNSVPKDIDPKKLMAAQQWLLSANATGLEGIDKMAKVSEDICGKANTLLNQNP
ncbi:MAG TPA: hypothetical protein VLG68_03790 [Gammaproteobacteria bacterium]|nr:hypothetical protein [Gammaproteobacteria bacterium]